MAAVFVVDDEEVIADTLAAILRQDGYCARSFTSPLAALAAARSKAPDLIISDVLMVELSGIDLAIQIKADCPKCKILLHSGQAESRDLLDDARRHGHSFELLRKPIHPTAMLARVRALSGPLLSEEGS